MPRVAFAPLGDCGGRFARRLGQLACRRLAQRSRFGLQVMSVKVSVGLSVQAADAWADAGTSSPTDVSEDAILHARESLSPGWRLSEPLIEPAEHDLDALENPLPRWAW